jgi:FkbM family methyltransferase
MLSGTSGIFPQKERGKTAFMGAIEISHPEDPAMTATIEDVLGGEYDCLTTSEEDASITTVLDIGGNVGAYALWARKRWPRATVHSYEPNPLAVPYFVENTKHDPKIVLHETAVVGVYPEAPVLLYQGKNSLVEASIKSDHDVIDITQARPVAWTHVSDLPRAQVVKCDAEGVEFEILSRYPWRWEKDPDDPLPLIIAYEYHSQSDYDEMCRVLSHCYYLTTVREYERKKRGLCVWRLK